MTAIAAAVLVVALAQAATSHTAGASAAQAARIEAQNRAAARSDATHLRHGVPLPDGATPSTSEPRADGGLLGQPGMRSPGVKLVDDHAFWTIAEPLQSVREFVSTHPPAGSRLAGTGLSGGPSVPANASFSFSFKSLPAGVASRSLSVALVALGPTLTGVRVDAQDVWLVPRPSSERVPNGVRSLRITHSTSQTGPGIMTGLAFTFGITQRAEIDQITRWIDALPIVQPGATSCPAQPSHPPRVRFAFLGTGGIPLAAATEDGNVREPTTSCDAMSFTVRGHSQPGLLNGARFLARVDRLLHLHLAGGGLGLGTGGQ
jgi:hypothetical protein